MQEQLSERLNNYIRLDHPDLLIKLNAAGGLESWLIQQVSEVENDRQRMLAEGRSAAHTEDKCMELMTAALRPSRFHYISELLEEDFEWAYYRMRAEGILLEQTLKMLQLCGPVFGEFGFCTANERDPAIRKAASAVIRNYLNDHSKTSYEQ